MTSLSLFIPRDPCASGVPSTCSCFSSAAEKVLGSFEDLSGCVASDQVVGGFYKVGLGAVSLSLPNTDLLEHHQGLTKKILVSVLVQRGH